MSSLEDTPPLPNALGPDANPAPSFLRGESLVFLGLANLPLAIGRAFV